MSRLFFGFLMSVAFQLSQAASLECQYLYNNQSLKLTTQILAQPTGSVRPELIKRIQNGLGLDDINFKYLQVLLGSYVESKRSKNSDSTIAIAVGTTIEVFPSASFRL